MDAEGTAWLGQVMKVVSLSFWRRPTYTRQVLYALKANSEIKNYHLVIGVDGGGDPRVLDEIEQIDFAPVTLLQHACNVGCNQNLKSTLSLAFSMSDYVIHIEDDILVAPDALKYFEWARRFEHDTRVLTVTSWKHDVGWQPTNPNDPKKETGFVGWMPRFFAWGWATWRSRWKEIEEHWTTKGDYELSWDLRIMEILNGRGCLCPYAGRSNNIGEELGTHRGAAWCEYWAGSPGFESPAGFSLVVG